MKSSRAAFSLIELIVVLAVCGVIIGVGVPVVLTYYNNAQNTTGAQQIRTLLNQARQMAIDQKDYVCVQVTTPTQLAFYQNNTSTGSPWTGSITDGSGNIALLSGFTLTASASPVFDYLGRVLPATTFTVTNATSGATLTVSVATSGRVTIP